MYLQIVGSHYCVMRFAYALHMHRQNQVLLSCLYTEPLELDIEIVFHYCTMPCCHRINLFRRPFRGSLVYTGNRSLPSDLLTEIFDFFFYSHGYERRQILIWDMISASFRSLRNTFCWYTSNITGAEHPSRIKNKIYMYTQTMQM